MKPDAKPRRWTIWNGWTHEPKIEGRGADIAYGENVKVIEHAAYETLEQENRELRREWESACDRARPNHEVEMEYQRMNLKLELENARLLRVIAQELTENDELGCEYTYVNVLRREVKGLREALEEIRDRTVDGPSDWDIACKALGQGEGK